MMSKIAVVSLSLSGTPAFADLEVRFIEGAPKDRFTFSASEDLCVQGPVAIDLDLVGSAGKLVFDVSDGGAGVEVFQPLEVVEGSELLVRPSTVLDGDQRVAIDLASLPPGASFAFTIDVDDTLGGREITVSGSEIAGAAVSVQMGDETRNAVFDASARATISWSSCDS